MNALLEKILARQWESDEDFHKTVNEIQKQSQYNPQEWQADLEAATAQARAKMDEADTEYDNAERMLALCENAEENDLNKAKAAAWDAYWNRSTWRAVWDALYEQMANVNFVIGNSDTAEGRESHRKYLKETYEKPTDIIDIDADTKADDELPF